MRFVSTVLAILASGALLTPNVPALQSSHCDSHETKAPAHAEHHENDNDGR